MTKIVRIWVDDKFHKMVKKQATDKGTSILKYTKELANKENPFNNGEKIEWKKAPKFKFKI